MANPIVTSLGRVQPLFKGEYAYNNRYNRLDNVFYEGSTYISLVDNNTRHYPTDTDYWQLVASRGQPGAQGITGSFGTPVASASILEAGSSPTVEVTASGPDEGKIFNFQFGIPAGPYGFDDVEAEAESVASDQPVAVEAELNTVEGRRVLNFQFSIPAADGQGAQSVDGITVGLNNDVNLSAVRYVNQNLSDAQKQVVRNNINALMDPSNKEYGSVLYYGGSESSPTWATKVIQEAPNGGNYGAILSKNSNADYDFIWIEPISLEDIDAIVNT